jgi:hypothetical protein
MTITLDTKNQIALKEPEVIAVPRKQKLLKIIPDYIWNFKASRLPSLSDLSENMSGYFKEGGKKKDSQLIESVLASPPKLSQDFRSDLEM